MQSYGEGTAAAVADVWVNYIQSNNSSPPLSSAGTPEGFWGGQSKTALPCECDSPTKQETRPLNETLYSKRQTITVGQKISRGGCLWRTRSTNANERMKEGGGGDRQAGPTHAFTHTFVVGTSTSESLSLLDILKPHTCEMLVPLTPRSFPPLHTSAAAVGVSSWGLENNILIVGGMIALGLLRSPRVPAITRAREPALEEAQVCVCVCVCDTS